MVFLESSQSSSPVMKVPFKFGKKNMTRERMLKTSNRRQSGSEGGTGNLPQGARLFIPQVNILVLRWFCIQEFDQSILCVWRLFIKPLGATFPTFASAQWVDRPSQHMRQPFCIYRTTMCCFSRFHQNAWQWINRLILWPYLQSACTPVMLYGWLSNRRSISGSAQAEKT